jgi:hypothetical protein
MKTPDAYLGLARVCGQKNDTKEAPVAAVGATQFGGEQIGLRAKITEGWCTTKRRLPARAQVGDELEAMLAEDRSAPARTPAWKWRPCCSPSA